MNAQEIIVKPLLSEKSYAGIADKVYTFQVANKANKTEIKNAVEQLFGVQVDSVRTAKVHGKMKRMGAHQGMTPSYKKAVVALKKDSKPIAFFESLS